MAGSRGREVLDDEVELSYVCDKSNVKWFFILKEETKKKKKNKKK